MRTLRWLAAAMMAAGLAGGTAVEAASQEKGATTKESSAAKKEQKAGTQTARQTPDVQATYDDIQQTLGLVPTFMREFPEAGIAGAWETMKGVELNPETALSGKEKELVGLAVAAQIPCDYCVYFHTQAARLHGATDQEIKEAVGIASVTRHWSTILNGAEVDAKAFAKDTTAMLDHAGKAAAGEVEVAPPAPVTDAESTYADARRTLGQVPAFLEAYPDSGVAGAWKEMRDLELGGATALPNKAKELIGLGVAAQIPCDYCVEFHTQAATQAGASEQEIAETLAMAAITRHWSTALNGLQIDERQFRRETRQIMKNLRRQQAGKAVSLAPSPPQPYDGPASR